MLENRLKSSQVHYLVCVFHIGELVQVLALHVDLLR